MQTLKLSVLFLFLEKELLEPFEKCLLQRKTFFSNGSEVEICVWDQVLSKSGFILLRRRDELKERKRKTENQGLAFVMQKSCTTGTFSK